MLTVSNSLITFCWNMELTCDADNWDADIFIMFHWNMEIICYIDKDVQICLLVFTVRGLGILYFNILQYGPQTKNHLSVGHNTVQMSFMDGSDTGSKHLGTSCLDLKMMSTSIHVFQATTCKMLRKVGSGFSSLRFAIKIYLYSSNIKKKYNIMQKPWKGQCHPPF